MIKEKNILLILKGNECKSEVVLKMLSLGKAVCVVYYDYQLSFGDFYVDSKSVSVEQFCMDLVEYFQDKTQDITKREDCFIVYTNKPESDVQTLIELINESKDLLCSKIVLLTCR